MASRNKQRRLRPGFLLENGIPVRFGMAPSLGPIKERLHTACEHCDGPTQKGKRFCSDECQDEDQKGTSVDQGTLQRSRS